MSSTTDEESSPLRVWGLLLGLALAVGPMLVRIQGPMDYVPWWDGDPLTQDVVKVGIDPPASLMADLISIIGAGLLLWLAPASRGHKSATTALFAVVLAGLGVAACWWHARGFEGQSSVIGSAWAGGFAAALGVWFASRGERGQIVRITVFALVLGAVGLLAVKGIYQYVWEHPATVASFKAQREEIFASNGWMPDSATARAYERRLMQREATGWFGFSNVYASFAAMGVAGFAFLAIGAWRVRRLDHEAGEEAGRGPLLTCVLGLCLSGIALALAGGKGGFAAAGIGVLAGVALLAVRSWGLSLSRFGWLIGPGILAAALGAVVARGLLGEKIGELSLLFRWFYLQGAMKVFAGEWLHGVGPGGFQAAYALAKNPLSPEDVTSPHSVLFDWAACLGAGGVALCVWLVWMSSRLGPAAFAAEPAVAAARHGAEPRALMRWVCVTASLTTMAAVPMQYAAMLPEEALGVRFGGLIVWCVLGCGVVAVASRFDGWGVSLVGGACVFLAHGQIEITPVLVQTGGLWLVLIAAAAAGGSWTLFTSEKPHRWPGWIGVGGCVVAGMCSLAMLREARVYTQRLDSAYRLANSIRMDRTRVERMVTEREPGAEAAARVFALEQPQRVSDIIHLLPVGWPTSRSASQMAMQMADQLQRAGRSEEATRWAIWSARLAIGDGGSGGPDGTELKWELLWEQVSLGTLNLTRAVWLSTVSVTAAERGIAPSRSEWLNLGLMAARQAAKLDPYNPYQQLRLMDIYTQQQDRDRAAQAAREVQRLNLLQRLDPAKQLSDRDRARVERTAALLVELDAGKR